MKNRLQQVLNAIALPFRSLKNIILRATAHSTLVSGQFRKTEKTTKIDYNFNMKEYFTLHGKIEENRRFLRETQDKYEKIRTYYPLFFIYIGFIGFYTFDILQYFLRTEVNSTQLFLGVLLFGHILVFGYVFYLFTKILILKDIFVEDEPKNIYNLGQSGDENRILEGLLIRLEIDAEKNFKILDEKKGDLSKLIKYCIFSFVIYITLITSYKILTMGNDANKQPEQKANEKTIIINNVTPIVDKSPIIPKARTLKDNREIDITKNVIDGKSDNNLGLIRETKTPCEQIDSIAKANKCDEFNKKYNKNSNYNPKTGQ